MWCNQVARRGRVQCFLFVGLARSGVNARRVLASVFDNDRRSSPNDDREAKCGRHVPLRHVLDGRHIF